MTQQSKKLIALLAFFLLNSKGQAKMSSVTSSENPNVVIEKIQAALLLKPELYQKVPVMAKSELEDLIQQKLSDTTFTSVQSLLADLAIVNVNVEITNPKGMVLASQEVYGGGKIGK